MGARTLFQIGALAAALASGCAAPFRLVWDDTKLPPGPGKSAPAALDNPVPPAAAGPQPPAYPSGVIPAAATVPAVPQPAPIPPPPGVPTLPSPRPLAPEAPAGPMALPPGGVPGPPVESGGPPIDGVGPHVRDRPSVFGERLNLGPWDHPLDRMGELSRRLDALSAENARLAGKLLERDALGAGREQALAEAMRTAEEANGAAAKAKVDVIAAQAEAAAARARLAKLEQEDVEFLRSLVDALTEAVSPPKGKEP